MIIYNFKESIRKLLKLINEFRRVSGYKMTHIKPSWVYTPIINYFISKSI